VGLSVFLGAWVGIASALSGPRLDAVLMRALDALLAVPRVLVFLLLATFLPPSAPLMVVALGATTWPGLARLVRAETMAWKASDLAAGARAVGASWWRLAFGHLVPHFAPVLGVTVALRFADTVVLESALAFIGLGSPLSLGGVLGSGHDLLASAWWVVAFPGLTLFAAVLFVRSVASTWLETGDPPSVT
jgi:peptide/nickel transport system permease protein